MTDGTSIIQTQQPSPSRGFTLSSAQSALSVEVAKCLKLVAPATMSADAQLSWIASAVDALDGIRADEVSAISAELRRSVTRPAQIVPEIARLVADQRKRRAGTSETNSTLAAAELRIDREARDRMGRAKNKDEVEEAWWWERQARKDAGLPVPPIQKPLSREELDTMPKHIAELGLKNRFLERRGGKLYEKTYA